MFFCTSRGAMCAGSAQVTLVELRRSYYTGCNPNKRTKPPTSNQQKHQTPKRRRMRTVICPQNSPCFPVLLEVAQWNKSYSEVDTRVLTLSTLVQPWSTISYRGFSSNVLSANVVYISAAALAPSSRGHFSRSQCTLVHSTRVEGTSRCGN